MIKKIAHRGLRINSKENTLESFYNAINSDCVGFECDVRQTKDKKLIIYHDPLYNGKYIHFINSKEIDNVLYLDDVLNINTNKMIVIDIKDPLIDINLFNNILKKYYKNIYVISFHNNVINNLIELKGNYKVGLLNYILNTNFDYNGDFICLLNIFNKHIIIDNYKNNNIELFFYGLNKEDVKDMYPYYILD